MPRHDEVSPLHETYSRLLSLAVHELRNPAGVVAGYLGMIQRGGKETLTDGQRKMIDEAAKSCARLATVIGELSEISRLDDWTAAFKDELVDLFQLVREVAAGVHEASERDVHLSVRGEESGARVTADPMRIRSAFGAFFRAILREQPGQATVVVDCRKADDGAVVIVVARDTDVQRTYEAPRARLDDTCAEPLPLLPRDSKLRVERGGLGLIVPIACRIVARYGGTVWSPPPGRESESGLTAKSALIISFPAEQQS
jgi:signal transduction histidine kinase